MRTAVKIKGVLDIFPFLLAISRLAIKYVLLNYSEEIKF